MKRKYWQNEDGTYTVTGELFDRLMEDSRTLGILRDAGVDNWDGYEEALYGTDQD